MLPGLALASLTLLAVARAGTPLLAEGDPGVAVVHASADTGLPPWSFDPVTPGALFAGQGLRVAGATVRACGDGPWDNAGARAEVDLARTLVLRQEWQAAARRFDRAFAALPCLSEPAEASLWFEAFFLWGVVEGHLGDAHRAREAFSRALAFSPDAAWDDRFVPESRPLFEAARAGREGVTPARILLGPGFPRGATLWIDGRLARSSDGVVEVAPGTHLVQVLEPAVESREITLVPGDEAVLLDGRRAAAGALDDLVESEVLPILLGDGLLPGAELYAWARGRTWRVGPGGWEALPVVDVERVAARRALGRRLVDGGTVAAAVGLAGAAAGWIAVARNIPERPGGDPADVRQARVDAQLPWAVAGTGLAVAGGVALAAGWRLRATAGPDSAALALEWGGAVSDSASDPGR